MLSLVQWVQLVVPVLALCLPLLSLMLLVAPVLLLGGPCAYLCHSSPGQMACILKAWTILLHLHKAWPREAPQLRTVGKDEGMNKSQSKTKQILHD